MRTTLMAALLALCLPAGRSADLDASQVKARYIHNFIKYITWPGAAPETQAFNIGVSEPPALKNALLELAKNAQSKPFQVVSPDAVDALNVVYIHEANRDRVGEILGKLPKSTLTIGEGPSFLARGGMIEFNLSEGKIRFSVNLRALREAGFSVDAKLLSVAQEVRK